MVIDYRGAQIELFPNRRALPVTASSGMQAMHRVVTTKRSAMISPRQLGVVFDHAMQVEGFITGEISFQLKDTSQTPTGFPAYQYPGLRKITNPAVYEVVARNPQEYIALYKRLQARGDLAWVEPIVTYGTIAPISRLPMR